MERVNARSLPAVAFALCAGACGGNGDDPNAWGRVSHVQRDGLFAIEYVAPPWEVLRDDAGLRLRIAPELFGYDVDVAASSHGLDVAAVAADDEIAELQGVEAFVPDDARADALDFEIPESEPSEPLRGIALDDPFAVARAELLHLVVRHDALIDFDLALLATAAGQEAVTYQVVTTHKTFLRAVYLPSEHGVVRTVVVSVFDVATADVDAMLDELQTDVPPPGGG